MGFFFDYSLDLLYMEYTHMLRIMSHPIQILKKLVGGNMEFYYEEETVVGKWFDKNVYAQSFTAPSPTNNQILLGTGDIEEIIFSVGSALYNDGKDRMYPFPYHTSIILQVGVNSNNNIMIETSGGSGWKNLKCTIFYTKTTD